jgi:hypothetical protein
MIDTIYLDLDDVCNTLSPCILWYLNLTREPRDYSVFPTEPMELAVLANRLLAERGVKKRFTRPSFWAAIPRRLWAEAPESPEFRWLLQECKHLAGASSVFIATSPTKDPDCLAGKLEWLHQHAPRWLHRQYFITPRKERLAQPGSLLIDDDENNCRKFEARGGRVIRFPRPWNAEAGKEPLPYLRGQLQSLENS